MTKPEPVRFRTTNWMSCNDALRRRGSLLIWLDKEMMSLANRGERRGRLPVFSDAAIQFCLMVKVLFGLPLRQATGMVASILEMAGLDWPVPDLSTAQAADRRPLPFRDQAAARQDRWTFWWTAPGSSFWGEEGRWPQWAA
jgi:hypothetical protein